MSKIHKLVSFAGRFAMDATSLNKKNRVNLAIFKLIAKRAFGHPVSEDELNFVFSSLAGNDDLHGIISKIHSAIINHEKGGLNLGEITNIVNSAAQQVKNNIPN